MPGLRILHYLVDLGYSEPTRVYVILQQLNGDLKMEKILQSEEFTLDGLYYWYQNLDIKRPLVFVDEPIPPIREFFRSKGVRIR